MHMKMVMIVGTRPEAIKMVPLYRALKKRGGDVFLCATNQHTDLLDQVFDVFGVKADIQLHVMQPQQDLFHITIAVLEKIKKVYEDIRPDVVIVQGDTTTAFAAGLGAFYKKIPVAHIEAGLRSGDMLAPFPEELNRVCISRFASYHFAPTAYNVGQLLAEGVDRDAVFCTGNTVVDALLHIKNLLDFHNIVVNDFIVHMVQKQRHLKRKLVLLTAHRRESFDGGLTRAFTAIRSFLDTHPDVFVIYPMHPNPRVAAAVEEAGLAQHQQILLLSPLSYIELVYVLFSVDFVVTDSGGIQEEAVSVGKPVLVLREVSERVECFWEGYGRLVGTDEKLIISGLQDCYDGVFLRKSASSVYGDGNAAERIADILYSKFKKCS